MSKSRILRSFATTRSGIQLQASFQLFEPLARSSHDLLEGEDLALAERILELLLHRRHQLVLLAHLRVRGGEVQAVLDLATNLVPSEVRLTLLGVPGYASASLISFIRPVRLCVTKR